MTSTTAPSLDHHTASTAPVSVTVYVDPSCPFAWITSRWLVEVAEHRSVDLTMRLMSLSVLNEGRELDEWYRGFNDRAWGAARVGALVQERCGAERFAQFYAAFGTRIHPGGCTDHPKAIVGALRDVGLPDELGDVASTEELDPVLRSTFAEVSGLVGEELGTPVVVVDGAAFFGPVLTSVPRGVEAILVFDLVRLAASVPAFTELKRGRTVGLSFA